MTAIPPVTPTATTTGAGASAPTTGSDGTVQLNNSSQFGKDTFLKLLVAQLKYQNPMSPTDPSTFMSQSAQFSMVEKLTEMATQTKNATSTSELANATAMIGKQVTYRDEGVDVRAVVKSVKVDPTNGSSLLLSSGRGIPLSAVTQVDAAPAA
ncbi:MAG: flagellar hook capping FlgD N-terminal domain-containing protein [Acidimicrobiia bacterium]